MILVNLFIWTYKRYDIWKLRNNGKKYLNNITTDEKFLLRRYIYNQTKTQNLSEMDGVVQQLRLINVLYRATNVGGGLDVNFEYNIQPWAWTYLNENKHLLK